MEVYLTLIIYRLLYYKQNFIMIKKTLILFFFIGITAYAEEKLTVMHGGTTNRIPISESYARMIDDPCDYISDADITVLTRQKASSKSKKKASDSPSANRHN